MKYLYITLLFLTILEAKECAMHVKEVKNESTQFMLTVTHDKACEVNMDTHQPKIVLLTKRLDANATTSTKQYTPNAEVTTLVARAKSKLGDSYVYAATGPDHFDCSGFVYYLFKESGVSIPRSSLPQSKSGKKLT